MAKFDPKKYKVDTTSLSQLSRLSTAHLQSVLKHWSSIGNQRAKRMKKIDPLYSSLLSYERGGKFGKSGVYKDRIATINELQRIKNIVPNLTRKKLNEESIALDSIYNEVFYNKKNNRTHLLNLQETLKKVKRKVKQYYPKEDEVDSTKKARVEEKITALENRINDDLSIVTSDANLTEEVKQLDSEVEELRALLPQKEFAGLLTAMISENRFRRGFALFKEKHLNISADIYDKLKSTVMKMNDRYVYHIEDLIDRLYEEYQEEVNQELGDTLPDDSLPW